jgi:hypothetical protein
MRRRREDAAGETTMSIPARPADHGSTLAPAVLATVAWIALGLQLVLSLHQTQLNGKPAVDGLVAYLGYFTVLSNLFVALVATDGARREGTPAGLYRASLAGCATTSIVVVGLGYHALLRTIWDPTGAQLVADVLLHYAVPALAVLHWLAYPHVERLPADAPLRWCAWPLAYFAYAMLRGEVMGSYPYPFIDVAALGYGPAISNALGLLVGFVAVGYVVFGVSRLLHARRGSSQRGSGRTWRGRL